MNTNQKPRSPRLDGQSLYPPFELRRVDRASNCQWRLDPETTLPVVVQAEPVPPKRTPDVSDPSELLMAWADAVQGGQPNQVVELAERALDLSMRALPGVSATSLAASVIAASARTELQTVGDYVLLADELRRCASDHRTMFSVISSRKDATTLQASLENAGEWITLMAADFDTLGSGEWIDMSRLFRRGCRVSRFDLLRQLSRLCSFGSDARPFDVSISAGIRRRLGPGRALREAEAILQTNPANTAARNVACACLVDLHQPELGLDHVAVSLLTPDRFAAATARRALREAGYLYESHLAGEIALLMHDRLTGEASDHVIAIAEEILLSVDRRIHAELTRQGISVVGSILETSHVVRAGDEMES